MTHVLSAVFIALGTLGVLRTSGDPRLGADGSDATLLVLVVHPVSSVLHLVIGLAGVAAARQAAWARLYLVGVAALLLAWALAGAVSRGRPNDALTGDAEVLVLYVVAAAAALAPVLWPERTPAEEPVREEEPAPAGAEVDRPA